MTLTNLTLSELQSGKTSWDYAFNQFGTPYVTEDGFSVSRNGMGEGIVIGKAWGYFQLDVSLEFLQDDPELIHCLLDTVPENFDGVITADLHKIKHSEDGGIIIS